jgi:hypothetical protein
LGLQATKRDKFPNFPQKYGWPLTSIANDQPTAAWLTDLKQRDMLKNTLVVWGGEFGRTPYAQGNDGRDHNKVSTR